MTFPIPDSALGQHLAILAKTGAGKTTTAKGVVEHVAIDQAARVCILDPIKSDWWGLISSADGKKPGLPFTILGGPHGHVPLNASAGKAIGELVATGRLPLSIVDMAHFEAGGLQRFFIDFADALLRNMRGVVYLIIEEAHEFAPKERSGIGAENMAVHWAKKLATAGRSKGIRLVVVSHRVQSLHNAVLGSCDTLVAMRLTAPADQKPVIDWLKANAGKDVVEQVGSSLSSLPTGTGWVVSGEARMFERVKFPMITTFDNSATPTNDTRGAPAVASAVVDQAQLRALIGEAVTQAEADDPVKLRTRIAELEKNRSSTPASVPDPAVLSREYQRGYDEGRRHGVGAGFGEAVRLARAAIDEMATDDNVRAFLDRTVPLEVVEFEPAPPSPAPPPAPAPAASTKAATANPGALTKSLMRCLNSLAWWRALGFQEVSRDRASIIAGLSPTASTFGVYIAKLRELGLVDNGSPGMVALTAAGLALAETPRSINPGDVVRLAREQLGKQAGRAFEMVAEVFPHAIHRDLLADRMGLSRTASTLGVYLAESSKVGFIETVGRGEVRAAAWLFPKKQGSSK